MPRSAKAIARELGEIGERRILRDLSRGLSLNRIAKETGYDARALGLWYREIGAQKELEKPPPKPEPDNVAEDPNELIEGLDQDELKQTAAFIDKRISPQERARLLATLARQKKNPTAALAALKLMTALKGEDKAQKPPVAPLFALPPDAKPDVGKRSSPAQSPAD